jgi:hypothetical protein
MADLGFAGTWETDWGTLELQVEGARVTGTYNPKAGRVEGLVAGNILRGTWTQQHAWASGLSWGKMELCLAPDGQSFKGTWTYTDKNAPGGGEWTGKRQKALAT